MGTKSQTLSSSKQFDWLKPNKDIGIGVSWMFEKRGELNRLLP